MRSLIRAALFLIFSCAAWAGVPEPEGYRMDHYRAPVPETLEGARVIDTAEAERLWRGKAAVFVDVLPKPPKPKLPEGTIYQEKPRHNIPGSVWLANVGFGALPPDMDDYYRRGLEEATGGDKAKPLAIYCLSECWMSWNAAKRAVGYGYGAVMWYPGGTDHWTDKGLPVELSRPLP